MKRHSIISLLVIVMTFQAISFSDVYAQKTTEAELMFDIATEHFSKGEYTAAIKIYDDILEMFPGHVQTLNMKGVALSNQDYHKQSLITFYQVLQEEPDNVTALIGLGVGFGNFAEYQEAKKYFERALELEPSDVVIKNYNEFADKVIKKYPYKPTEKPTSTQSIVTEPQIPLWVKNNAAWWAAEKIPDSDFISGIKHLIKEKIIVISDLPTSIKSPAGKIPSWVKSNAGWWAEGKIPDSDFVKGIGFLIENGILVVNTSSTNEDIKKDKENELALFKQYVNKIERVVLDEKRYIEYPNPSGDVIKKFLRDYAKWNFEQQIQSGSELFQDPTVELIDDVYIFEYKIFVNDQPQGLPLDHVSTLDDSIAFWESQEFTSNKDGLPVKVKFTYTTAKDDATTWVTWVVRNLGEGVLGHANLGKGVAEIALGDYGCDGSFQLYDVETVELIMTHELGHILGQGHTDNPASIMYPSLNQNYAYCLLK